MFSVRSAAIAAVTLWVFMLFYLSAQLFGLQGKARYEEGAVSSQLEEALQDLRELKVQNENLKELIKAERRERAERDRDLIRKEKYDTICLNLQGQLFYSNSTNHLFI
ncbi:unnamed protein product [Strongylus vulgaris]|uniref:Alpha-(1,6)-fucosyltransferase N- and catalytic domain-containing protein n=1 Tax=Strongylus vulgaris TaxID=40348 RepID=A0A3P7J6A2_STRVU|nr:unnamed protein product [Strongylus vulgaris]